MKIETKFYIVIDDTNMLWERADDFDDSGDYFDKDLSTVESKDLMTIGQATKWKDELDKEISSNNNIKFTIKEVELNVL
jgi:hypothetical protein